MIRDKTSNTRPYIKLAAALVESGIKQHDTEFLESDWCAYLKESVKDYVASIDEMENDSSSFVTQMLLK